MNPNLAKLQPYPFEKLAKLKDGIKPPSDKQPIMMSVGEPQHATPEFIRRAIEENLDSLSRYPTVAGTSELKNTIANWLTRRFNIKPGLIDPEWNVLPVNGTREALFAIAQTVVDPQPGNLVLTPNPFYQIYEGAALLAGAEPYYVNIDGSRGLRPNFDAVPEDVWKKCRLLYLCSPGNPTGAVESVDVMAKLIQRARSMNFVIACDECYSEIYFDEQSPPWSLLQVAAKLGNESFENCLVFHSLSKRSNVPGMRSGFVAGDAKLIEKFRLYRTYHGSAMSPPFQAASVAAWSNEDHVIANRKLYKRKFDEVMEILNPALPVERPEAGFYLWANTPLPDEEFAQKLFARQNVTVLPGSYLSRVSNGINPGAQRVRIALVPSLTDCVEAAKRLRDFVTTL
jgi:N-succinyldiaminopimelate aminotransferase